MSASRIISSILLVATPTIVCYALLKQLTLAIIFCIANLSVLLVWKPRLSHTLTLTLLCIEALLIMHFLPSSSGIIPNGSPISVSNLDADHPSFGYLSVPFVSLVLLGADAKQAVSKWRDEAPKSLVKEVLVHGESEPQGVFTVFINAGADPVGENFLAFLVREIMNTHENEKCVFVPSVLIDGHEFSHGVSEGRGIRKFDEPKLPNIWVLPEIGAFIVRTKYVSLVQTLADGDLVEGSLDVWRCGGALKLATLAKMRINTPLRGQKRTPSACAKEKTDEEIAEFFSDYIAPKKMFRIAYGTKCMTYNNSLTLGISDCNDFSDSQLFGHFDGGRALRSAESCKAPNSAPGCLCLDVGPNPAEGQAVNLYFCRPDTVSQQVEVAENRLMWGSYCVDSALKLRHCDDEKNLEVTVL